MAARRCVLTKIQSTTPSRTGTGTGDADPLGRSRPLAHIRPSGGHRRYLADEGTARHGPARGVQRALGPLGAGTGPLHGRRRRAPDDIELWSSAVVHGQVRSPLVAK